MTKQTNKSEGRTKLLVHYVKESVKAKRYLSLRDMKSEGFTREMIRTHFDSLEGLKEAAKENYGKELQAAIIEERIDNPSKAIALSKDLKKYKRFVVTTAVDGAPAHKGFLKSIETYCKVNNAALLILPSGKDIEQMDEALVDKYWIFQDTDLNSNIRISSIKLSAKSANPLTSLNRIGQKKSLIVASPKQFLEYVPVGTKKLPHAIMSTGSITISNYANKNGSRNGRADYIATNDHIVAAIIIEIEDKDFFHFRQIQADSFGGFNDLSTYYRGASYKKESPLAFIMGDLHAGETDPTAKSAWKEVIKETGVNKIYLHDAFNGESISHHNWTKYITRARLANENRISLLEELKQLGKELDDWSSIVDEVLIVKSNHDDFLSKHYLQGAKYVDEPNNHSLGLKLASAMIEGEDALKFAVENVVGIKNPKKIRWLARDEESREAGIECGSHGDKGGNGAKGSAATLEKSLGQCVVGHSHTPKIVRGFWQVGTTSILKPDYAEGPSGWVHCSALVFKNGGRQLINSFGGKWRIKK